jgi:hypothetical protein
MHPTTHCNGRTALQYENHGRSGGLFSIKDEKESNAVRRKWKGTVCNLQLGLVIRRASRLA